MEKNNKITFRNFASADRSCRSDGNIIYIYMYKLGQSYRALIHRRLFQRGGIEGRVSELIERASFFSSRFAPPTL